MYSRQPVLITHSECLKIKVIIIGRDKIRIIVQHKYGESKENDISKLYTTEAPSISRKYQKYNQIKWPSRYITFYITIVLFV